MEFKDLTMKLVGGKPVRLSDYQASLYLVVNTACLWGFTPQFGELEQLNKKYQPSGLQILGFPCNQFGGQDPWENDKIKEFAESKYGVTFPLFEKSDVNGTQANPLYQHIKSFGNEFSQDLKWNFTKFLLDKQGSPIKRYEGAVAISEIEKDVIALLSIK